MITDSFRSLGFSLSGLAFMVLILFLFLGKEKDNKLHTKVFYILIIITIVAQIFNITYVEALAHSPVPTTFAKILCYGYSISSLLWLSVFALYLVARGNQNLSSKKVKLFIGILAVITLGILACIFIFPVYYHHENNFYFFNGQAITIEYIYATIITLLVFPIQLMGSSFFDKYQRLPLLFGATMILLALLMPWVTHTNFNMSAIIFEMTVTTLYFTIESQDNALTRQLKEARVEAEKANKAKTKFLTSISHDIRTPLNTIMGFSESLLEDEHLEEQEVRKDISLVNTASKELLEIINNILDISRIESGKEVLNEADYSLDNLIFEINSVVQSKVNKEEIDYKVTVNQNIPQKYFGDYSKLHKAISCTLMNAIKHTRHGQVYLIVDGVKENENIVFEFTVGNTGHEMTQEDFEKDLDGYLKLDDDINNSLSSNMLSVVIAKRMIDLMGGKIDFINEPGKGTQYHIFVTQKIIDDTPVGDIFATNNENNQEDNILDLTGKKILVVDDSLVNIKLACRLLKGFHFEIDTATGGDECINLVKDNNYDLIFLDHMMPNMDGIETMKALKSLGKQIPPVIILTANSYDGLKEKYLSAGFSDYLAKPISFKKLNKIIIDNFKK